MISDDNVILELFRHDLVGRDVCFVYGRLYVQETGWQRAPDGDAKGGPMLSVSGPDGSVVPIVEERDLMTRMAQEIIALRYEE